MKFFNIFVLKNEKIIFFYNTAYILVQNENQDYAGTAALDSQNTFS
jgi:hypothetical protein